MFSKLKSLFGGSSTPAVDVTELARQGALILDVRTPAEYGRGHIPGSMNIPIDALSKSLGKLKQKERPIITCCASGSRSAIAAKILRSQGYASVHNGGGWTSLKARLGK